MERPAEGAEAAEADVEADVGDAAFGLAQEEHRALHATPLEVPMRRLPEDGPKAADEVRHGDIGHRGHRGDVERLGVRAVHGVPGTQQATVQVLDVPAHAATLRHPGSQRSLGRLATTHHPAGSSSAATTSLARSPTMNGVRPTAIVSAAERCAAALNHGSPTT